MQERRKFIRYDIEANVVFKIEGGSSRVIKGDVVNIGFQGMSVYALEKMPENIVASFELITKLCDKPIIGEGKIIYVRATKRHDVTIFQVGIEFTQIDNEAIQYILARIQEDICAQARKKRPVS